MTDYVVASNYTHAAHCVICQTREPGSPCPHCINGVYATDVKGRPVTCDACCETGKVVAVSDFAALAAAVTDGDEIDTTAALALADFLDEHNDERGKRLRLRVRKYERRMEFLRGPGPVRLVDVEMITTGELNYSIRHEVDLFASYLFRLLASEPGSRLPRVTVSGCFVLREPTA